MFGYRLLRDADYSEMKSELATARAAVIAAHLEHAKTLTQLAEAKATAAARASANDHLVMSVNESKLELGQLRAKVTGMPAIVPQIGKGAPLSAEGIGAGVDLFEDVGDDRARDLGARGLLHDDQAIGAMPAGSELSSLDGDTA